MWRGPRSEQRPVALADIEINVPGGVFATAVEDVSRRDEGGRNRGYKSWRPGFSCWS